MEIITIGVSDEVGVVAISLVFQKFKQASTGLNRYRIS